MKVIYTHTLGLLTYRSDPNCPRLGYVGELSSPPNTGTSWAPLLTVRQMSIVSCAVSSL